MKSTGCLYWIYKLYERFCKKHRKSKNLKREKEKHNKLNLFILGPPQCCLFLLKIRLLLYINIVLNIIKQASIFFLFIICQEILYQLNKIKFEDDENKKKLSRSEKDSKLNIK